MAHEHLATYLNDHLAGAVVAIDLLQDLEAEYTGMTRSLAELRGVDYERLAKRAQEQRQCIEVLRLQAAKTALA